MTERKLVTVLFADIVGSTPITVSRDPELVRAALQQTFDGVRPILESHGGTVEKFIGDEVMAVFGVPAAHDDDADRATRAAFAIRERVRELSARPKAISFELRIGINTGETVAGTGEGGQFLVTGEPVIAAARIRGSAEPGEIVVGALTYRLTRGGVSYGEPRSFDAKGLGLLEAWPALALRSEVPAQHRGIEGLRSPLIGRDEELRLLFDAYERMRTEARPYLVTVFGAAGAGKSRLTDEFIARLDGARVRQGRCLPYGEGISLWPIQLILQADAGIARTDDLATARERLRHAVTATFPAGADDVDAVGRRLEVLAGFARADDVLPEVAPVDLTDELAWGLRRYLERRAHEGPLVLVFEDIHWAARALLELIEHLAEWAKAPLFLLCLARPEFLDARPGWGGGKVNAASIVLEPLTLEETRVLVAKLLDIDSLTEGVRAAVVERAEGNPLYVEEFVRLLIESGQIAQRDGRWVAANVGPLDVPPTLKGLIAARIDAAPAEVKTLLQRAAVVGRLFSTTGVAALSDGKPPEIAHLRDAVRRDLLVDVDERGVGGGRVYRFKHVLTRDVGYASVPKAERALLHDRYVRWYEDALGDRREDFIDLLAHHAEQAYLLASEMAMPRAPELARRAFDRLLQAAAKARVREDDAASLALYQRTAATADEAGPTQVERLELDTYLALARHKVEASPEALTAVDRAIEQARVLGETRLLIDLLAVRHPLYVGEQRDHAREEMRSLALATGEPEQVVRALVERITDVSSFSEDIGYLDEALKYATAHGLEIWRLRCLQELAFRHRIQLRFADDARCIAEWERSLGPAPSRRQRADLLFQKAHSRLLLIDLEPALRLYDDVITLRRELGHFRWAVVATLQKAYALVRLGRASEAVTLNGELIATLEGKATPVAHRATRLNQAYYLAAAGRVREARAMLDAGLVFPQIANIVDWLALWASALVVAAEGDLARAVGLLNETAAEFARLGQIDPWFVFDRADILMRAGRTAEARGVLEDLRAKLTDPLGERLRVRTDELLRRCAAITAGA